MDGLEAVWAEISVGKIMTVIGSVYVPPGDCCTGPTRQRGWSHLAVS